MNIVAKKCTSCFEVLPTGDFRFETAHMRYCSKCRHCEKREALARYHIKAATKAWAEDEVALLRQHYPMGGSAVCKPHLPKRSVFAIQFAARKHGLIFKGSRVAGSPPKESAWAVPMHEYTEPDIALRAWRCAMPVASMRCAL